MGRDGIGETTGLAEGPEIAMAADRLRDVSPMAAAYVDTSISFVRGLAGDAEIAGRLASRLGCPSVTTSTGVAEALSELGARADRGPVGLYRGGRGATARVLHGARHHDGVDRPASSVLSRWGHEPRARRDDAR